MSAPTTPADLLDLKLMPAWVNEPARANDYSNFEGEEDRGHERSNRGSQRERGPRPGGPRKREEQRDRPRRPEQRRPERQERPRDDRPPREAPAPLPQVAVRFIPHPAAFESVIAQIKSASVTYSVFALARMFLDKPERYNVKLTAPADSPLHQLGEGGPVAVDRRILEGGAFAEMRDEFYTTDVTQSEPVKGNFTNVARDRISGTLLGPTNHHGYQPQLRSLYEQRYSRRMSFQDFQRQIEMVSDPAIVEQWKEQARSVTTFATKKEEPPVSFKSMAEAEHHFRQTYLPTLFQTAQELTMSGVLSRRLPDRGLGRVIENAWSAEIRSPSNMMQELAGGLRGGGLNIFRHRRGMLFVSPIRIRSFSHESTGVSASINAILQKLGETAGVNRKQLAEQLVAGIEEAAEVDRIKLSLASDLRWLISEGYVIEFNDGSLDLPKTKAPVAAPVPAAATADVSPSIGEADAAEQMVDTLGAPLGEAGGMRVDQAIEPRPENEPRAEPLSAEPADEMPEEAVPSPS